MPTEVSLSRWRPLYAVLPALIFSTEAADMPSVALPAPAVLVECPCEAQLAAVVSTEAVGRALRGICGSVPRRIVPVRAELASGFWAQVSVWALFPRLQASCVPIAPATETSRREPEAEGKAGSRDGPLSLAIASLDR